jgi:uncharacterized protein YbcI
MAQPLETTLGGRLHQEIADSIVQVQRRVIGRGPPRVQAFHRHNVVVVLLEDGLTRAEQSLLDAGRGDTVKQVRDEFQLLMREELVAIVERITGCRVDAFMSATHLDPDLAVEVFVLDRPPEEREPPPGPGGPPLRPA